MSWDLWRNGVSASLVYKFLQCKEQFRLHYIENLRRRSTRFHQDFGSLFHSVLETWYDNRFAVRKTEAHIGKWLDNLEFSRSPNMVTGEQLRIMEALARALFSGYRKFYLPIDKHKKWQKSERRFRVPYEYPDGKKTWLKGYIDLTYLHRNSPRLLDTKVLSRIDSKHIVNGLSFDFQVMLYLYVNDSRQIEYNIVRRPSHNLIKADDGSIEAFTTRKMEEVNSKPKYFFMRFPLTVRAQDLKNWKKFQLDPIMQELRLWTEGKIPHYLNPTSLETIYGECDLYEYIVMGNDRSVYEHVFPTISKG